MRIVGREELRDFATKHPDCRTWFSNWIADTERARWQTSQDIKARYVTSSFLGENVVIFNVRGNEYRLVVKVLYQTSIVIVLWVGKHTEYVKKQF
jgi:mRNA interferase HigB